MNLLNIFTICKGLLFCRSFYTLAANAQRKATVEDRKYSCDPTRVIGYSTFKTSKYFKKNIKKIYNSNICLRRFKKYVTEEFKKKNPRTLIYPIKYSLQSTNSTQCVGRQV